MSITTAKPDPVRDLTNMIAHRLMRLSWSRCKDKLEEITTKQRELVPSQYNVYSHAGMYYSPAWSALSSKLCFGGNGEPIKVEELDPRLLDFHLEWKEGFNLLHEEEAKIRQTVASLLIRHKEKQQWRNMFPDLLTDGAFIDPIPRTSVSLCLVSNPEDEVRRVWPEKSIKLYNKIAGVIGYYAGQQIL